MKITRKLLVAFVISMCGAAALWLCTSSDAGEITYEVRPQVAVPYGYTATTDASRLIDILEQMLVQGQQMTFNQLTGMDTTLKSILQRLEAIEKINAELSQRLGRVEAALDVNQPQVMQQPTTTKPKKEEK